MELLLGRAAGGEDVVHAQRDVVVDRLENREEQLFLGREVLVDGPLADPGALGDFGDPGRGVALLGKDGACRLDEPKALVTAGFDSRYQD